MGSQSGDGLMFGTLVDGGSGRQALVAGVQLVGANGVALQGQSYTLYPGGTLAASTAATAVTGVAGGSYVWSYQFGGTTPSLVLESLGPDGVTYQTIATVTASGTQGVVIGNNATVRVRNGTANAITNLYSSLT